MTDLASEEELVCPKCGLFGCDCDEPSPFEPLGICERCRRAFPCICKSHVELKPLSTQVALPMPPPPRAERDNKVVARMVNEAMHMCYGRDHEGLRAYLAKHFR